MHAPGRFIRAACAALLLAAWAAGAWAADAPAGSPPVLNSFTDLEAADRQPLPAGEACRLYRLQSRLRIYVLLFASPDAMLDTLGRVMCWFDIPGGKGKLQAGAAEAAAAVRDALKGYDIGGVHYTSAQFAEVYTAYSKAGAALSPEETRLLGLLVEAGWLGKAEGGYSAGPGASLVAVPPRADIASLRHELNHALYAQDPAYRKAVAAVWANKLSEGERHAFIVVMEGVGYNTENVPLMRTEFSAYGATDFPPYLFEKADVPPGRLYHISALLHAREAQRFPFLHPGVGG